MPDINRIEKIAQHLWDAHTSKTNFKNLDDELKPLSESDAYGIQHSLIKLWEKNGKGTVVGHKVALTSKAIQELVGVDTPVKGSIFSSTIYRSPAAINLDDFVHLGLEFELAFVMGKDVPKNKSFDINSISEFIDAAMPAFELIEDRNADYRNIDPLTLIADNAWCGGIVLGTPSQNWRKINLSSTQVHLSFNNEIEEAITGAAMGNPLNSVAWLASFLSEQGRPLKKGDIIMSGSTLATKFAKRGDKAVYTIEGIGKAEANIR